MNFVEDFRVPLWLFNGHLQTIWPATVGKKHDGEVRPSYFREKWKTPDNDFIEIDFNQNFYKERNPIVVLFHGLEGSSSSYYSLALQACKEFKFSLSIPHFRGCSGLPNKLHVHIMLEIAKINWILEKYSKICAEQNRKLYIFGVSSAAILCFTGRDIYLNSLHFKSSLHCINLRSYQFTFIWPCNRQKINRLVYASYFLRSMKRKARDKWYQYPDDFHLRKCKTQEPFMNLIIHTLHLFTDF